MGCNVLVFNLLIRQNLRCFLKRSNSSLSVNNLSGDGFGLHEKRIGLTESKIYLDSPRSIHAVSWLSWIAINRGEKLMVMNFPALSSIGYITKFLSPDIAIGTRLH